MKSTRAPGAGPFRPLALLALVLASVLPPSRPVEAQAGAFVRITLQPDCFRPSLAAACDRRKTGRRLDLGPQIAIWIESADGSRFVDTVLVTKLTALLGIGNRPGHATMPSGPKYPYGRRPMTLPVWAHRRGKLYDSLVMQDGVEREHWLGFHEIASSPDPYYCRPMTWEEIDVDAVSCPTQRFNSVKGRPFSAKLDVEMHSTNGVPNEYVPPPKSYYPPRNDLATFTDSDCDQPRSGANCNISARKFAEINDLDLVAAATPPYGRPFSKLWRVPDGLADGDYAVYVEVSKEFDGNASHQYPAHVDQMLPEWGQTNNFGQPSVVYRVPFRLSRTAPVATAVTTPVGYGDPLGGTGKLTPIDGTISDEPGSGAGRLLVITQPPAASAAALTGRVLVATELSGTPPPPPPPPDAGTGPIDTGEPDAGVDAPSQEDGQVPPPPDVSGPPPVCLLSEVSAPEIEGRAIKAEIATFTFLEPALPHWNEILEYEVHRWGGKEMNEGKFTSGLPLAAIAKRGPGQAVTVTVDDLKSESEYTVGVRAVGFCGNGPVGYETFVTPLREFTMLSGCFIATAAYGSPLAADVNLLRGLRDRASQRHPLASTAAELYARSSPPVAHVLAGSDAARAVARGVIGPIVELARALELARASGNE